MVICANIKKDPSPARPGVERRPSALFSRAEAQPLDKFLMAPKVLELSARLPPALRSPTFNERPRDRCPMQNEKKM